MVYSTGIFGIIWSQFKVPWRRVPLFMSSVIGLFGLFDLMFFVEQDTIPGWLPWHWLGGVISLALGCIIMWLETPECWFKVTFDIWGASHQIFHLLCNLGTCLTAYAAFHMISS